MWEYQIVKKIIKLSDFQISFDGTKNTLINSSGIKIKVSKVNVTKIEKQMHLNDKKQIKKEQIEKINKENYKKTQEVTYNKFSINERALIKMNLLISALAGTEKIIWKDKDNKKIRMTIKELKNIFIKGVLTQEKLFLQYEDLIDKTKKGIK